MASKFKKTRIQGNTVPSGLPVAASFSTNLSNATNNDLTFTANKRGLAGNDITVTYVVSGNNTALSAAVSGSLTSAALTTALTGTNNDLDFTSRESGSNGNSTTIAYVDPAANNAALSVVVTGKAIVVNLATGSDGAITSTAAQVAAAIQANNVSNKLVTVANTASNDGSGVVTALTATNLAGGKPASDDIVVTVATNGSAVATSTAAQVKAACDAVSAIADLVTITNKTGNDGTGVVAAQSKTALSGGVNYVLGASSGGIATRYGR